MINVRELKAYMAKKGKTGKDVANALNIAPNTFYRKVKKGVFGTDEVTTIVKLLDIPKDKATIIFLS